LRVEATSVQAIASGATLTRLARQFREDVHAAVDAELTAGDDSPARPTLRLTMPAGGEISFQTKGDAVLRTARQLEESSREHFNCTNASVSFEVSENRGLVSMVIFRREPNAGNAESKPDRATFHIEAALARNQRVDTRTGVGPH
jgi:hypothetical protein